MNYDDFENDKKKTHDKVAIHQLINFNNDANNIKISVVVPIFNVEDYIGDCLDSILDQSLKEFEVICVNDGSTDSSLEILKEYAAKDNRIKIINKDNAGYGHTMNIGMDMASGEYFVIVESDDFILPKMFETLYDAAKENDLDFVKSDFYRFYGEDNKNIIKEYQTLDKTKSNKYYNKIFSTHDNHDTYKLLMNTWTGLYKLDFLRKNNIRHSETPGASYQDNGFWFKTFFYGERVMFIPEPFYMYRRDNPNSSIRNKTKIYAMDTEYDLIDDFLNDCDAKKDFLDAFVYAKYHNFNFTMNRIGLEFKKEFLLSTSEYFNEMKKHNELDTSLLDEYDLNMLNWIVERPEEYYDYMYNIESKDFEFLKKYLECRIDIKNLGSENNDVLLIDSNDSLQSFYAPDWFKDSNGIGHVLTSNAGSLDLSFKCVNDGTINLNFKGIDYSDKNGNRIPIYVDYTEITVDDENLVSGSKVFWHDNPFNFQKSIKDGQIINVKVKWRPISANSLFRITSDSERLLNVLTSCRIDIKNNGQYNNNIKIIDCPDLCDISNPNWLNDNSGVGSVLKSTSGNLDVSFECINDGNLHIAFRGADLRNRENERIPIFIEYHEIKIDGEYLFYDNKITWHDKPVVFNKRVKNGQIVNIKAKWGPVYSNSAVLDNSLNKFSTVRIDLKNYGGESNNILLLNENMSFFNISQPKWFADSNGTGSIITSDNKELDLSVKCINEGKLKIDFRSMDFKDSNNNRIPIYIDYREIKIDGKSIINDSTVLWHDNKLEYSKDVKDGQIVDIKLKWKPLNDNSDCKNILIDSVDENKEIKKLKKEIESLTNKNKKLKEFNDSILNSQS